MAQPFLSAKKFSTMCSAYSFNQSCFSHDISENITKNINNNNGKKRDHLNFLRVTVLGNKLELSSAKLSSLSWVELRLSLVMTVVMQLELILKYFKTAFKDF